MKKMLFICLIGLTATQACGMETAKDAQENGIATFTSAMDLMDSSYIRCSDRVGGPIYAANWERINQDGKQIILLYGDFHTITHPKTMDLECQSCKTIDTIFTKLNSVNTKTLILHEDSRRTPFWNNILSDQDTKIILLEENQRFGGLVSQFAQAVRTNPHCYLQAECIDARTVLSDFIPMGLDYLQLRYTEKPLTEDAKSLLIPLEKAYNAVKDIYISEALELPITTIQLFSDLALDDETKTIFNEIVITLKARKILLWNKIATDTGLSYDELNEATVGAIGIFMKTDLRYRKLALFLMSDAVGTYFSGETVEAGALHHITNKQNYNSKIVMFGGKSHVRAIEKYLLRLGFAHNTSVGQEFALACEESDQADAAYKNAVDLNHSLRVLPLSSYDKFGFSLFKDTIENAEETSCLTAEQKRLRTISVDKLKIEINLLSTTNLLVPLEAFEWINQ